MKPSGGQKGLLVAAALLYVLSLLMMLPQGPGSDAAGRGMAGGFAILLQFPLWLLLLIFLVRSVGRAQLPPWVQAAAVAGALAALAGCVTALSYTFEPGHGWLRAIAMLLPPLAMAVGLQARPDMPREEALTYAAALIVLVAPPAYVHARWGADAPRRKAESATILAENERQQKEISDAYYARLRALGPDSPLEDFLEFVDQPPPDGEEATAKLRNARSRQADTIAWLAGGGDFDDAKLHQWNLEPSAELCRAYREALLRRLARSDYDSPDYSGALAELRPQVPTLLWLHARGCDLRAPAELWGKMLGDPKGYQPPQPAVEAALRRVRG